jgi:hypothetical protein
VLNSVEQVLVQGKAFRSEGVNLILCIFEFCENSYRESCSFLLEYKLNPIDMHTVRPRDFGGK